MDFSQMIGTEECTITNLFYILRYGIINGIPFTCRVGDNTGFATPIFISSI